MSYPPLISFHKPHAERFASALVRLPLALAVLLSLAVTAMGAVAPHWQAVLVAGDDREPVFDNAVETFARWLFAAGDPEADIHRLSADQPAGSAAREPASAERLLARIAGLRPRAGEGCLVFITSHGGHGDGVWLAVDHDYLRPAPLARALDVGCGGAPTVAIVSSCYSGSFTAIRAPNRIVITAARADRPSFGCQAGRTYTVFDECLLAVLPRERTWRAVFDGTRGCVQQREQELDVLPSQPQAVFGAAVKELPVR
jgi:hypothetical protein